MVIVNNAVKTNKTQNYYDMVGGLLCISTRVSDSYSLWAETPLTDSYELGIEGDLHILPVQIRHRFILQTDVDSIQHIYLQLAPLQQTAQNGVLKLILHFSAKKRWRRGACLTVGSSLFAWEEIDDKQTSIMTSYLSTKCPTSLAAWLYTYTWKCWWLRRMINKWERERIIHTSKQGGETKPSIIPL